LKDIKLIPKEDYGRGFVPINYLPEGKDEYYLRNQQSAKPQGYLAAGTAVKRGMDSIYRGIALLEWNDRPPILSIHRKFP
jgi:hypothetical protein